MWSLSEQLKSLYPILNRKDHQIIQNLRGRQYRKREQSFCRGASKPCGEWEGDAETLWNFLVLSALASRRFAARTLRRAKTIPLVTQAIKEELSVVS